MSESLANLHKREENIVYSTDERIIGKIVLNGVEEDLYSKTISFTTNNSASPKQISTGISNLKHVINGKGMIFTSTQDIPISMYWEDSYTTGFLVNPDPIDTVVLVRAGYSTWQNSDAIITLEYTKS
jgi:hypothetical protein